MYILLDMYFFEMSQFRQIKYFHKKPTEPAFGDTGT